MLTGREYARPCSLRGAILGALGVTIPKAKALKKRCCFTETGAQIAENAKKSVHIISKNAIFAENARSIVLAMREKFAA